MDSPGSLPTLGILGAGRVGTALARLALKAGYRVLLANSGRNQDLEPLIDALVPGAHAATADEAASRSDLVYLALPIGKYQSLPRASLAGKTVIDGMNYWPAMDGVLAEFESTPGQSSELIQDFLEDSRVVKTLNHIGYHDLENDSTLKDPHQNRALVVAGNDPQARAETSALIHKIGFVPVDAGPLANGWKLSPVSPIFGRYCEPKELQHRLDSLYGSDESLCSRRSSQFRLSSPSQ